MTVVPTVFSEVLQRAKQFLIQKYNNNNKFICIAPYIRVVVKYRYLYLSTILSVLDVLEYLIGENAKYLYLIQSTW